MGSLSTFASGINNASQIVGSYADNSGTHGFLDSGGVFSAINVPGSSYTSASGINDAGQVVGEYTDSSGSHAFLDTGGVFSTINVPGSNYTEVNGVNNKGQIVGIFGDSAGIHSFLDSGGVFSILKFPAAPIPPTTITATFAYGINNAGQIVGEYNDGSGFYPYLYSGGVYSVIDFPGFSYGPKGNVTDIVPRDINDQGDMVGTYEYWTGSPSFGGFAYFPTPEPSSIALLISVTGFAIVATRFRPSGFFTRSWYRFEFGRPNR